LIDQWFMRRSGGRLRRRGGARNSRCAWSTATARRSRSGFCSTWLRGFDPSPQGIQRVAAESRNGLIAHESELDVRVSESLTAPERHAGSFFTVNHPTTAALGWVVAGIHAQLRIAYTPPRVDEELLGTLRTPLESSVIAALRLAAAPRPDWTIRGETVTLADLLVVHLAWYDEHRDLVAAGLSQHEGRLWLLGLTLCRNVCVCGRSCKTAAGEDPYGALGGWARP
jgi:hypothetical protein